MKKYLYLIKNSKIPTYLKYWLMYSSKKISLLIQSLPITLENTIKDLKIVINKIYGNSEQNTTTGKNLLPPLDSGSLNGLTFTTNSNGITTISGTTTNVTNYFKNVNKILPAGTYTLSINLSYTPPASSSQLILQDINNVRLATINLWKITSRTFTLSADTEIKNYYLFSNSGIQHNGTISIQLEEGSTATSYEPYTGGIPSPNPSYPQEITNVTGDVEVVVENKNLLNISQLDVTVQGMRFKGNEDNELIISGTYTGSVGYISFPHKNINLPTGTYTFTAQTNNIPAGVSLRLWTTPTNLNLLNNNHATTTQILTGYTFALIGITNNTTYNIAFKIQLEKGENATNVIPSHEQTFTFPLGNEKLMLGDYLADDGIHHVRGQVVLDGTENWLSYTSGNTENYNCFAVRLETSFKKSDNQYLLINAFSNYFKEVAWIYIYNASVKQDKPEFGFTIDNNKYAYIKVKNTISTAQDLKTWLAQKYANNSPVIIEYPLNEEIIVPYTSAQQEVYNQIKQALSYEGQTNISSNQNIYLDIDYIKRG